MRGSGATLEHDSMRRGRTTGRFGGERDNLSLRGESIEKKNNPQEDIFLMMMMTGWQIQRK